MPKYLLLFKYSSEGAKGFLKEKAAPREAEIRKTFAGMGGKVVDFYWATGGEHSGAIVVELPDAATPTVKAPAALPSATPASASSTLMTRDSGHTPNSAQAL